MAKPKFDAKKFLLEKGEKVGIVAAGALMLLLIIWGVMTMIGSANTPEVAGNLSGKAKGIQNRIASDTSQSPKPLEPWVTNPVKFETLWAKNYENNPQFSDIAIDDAKRGRPNILMPVEFQLDLVRAPIATYNITGGKDPKIAVVFTKEVQKNDKLVDFAKKRGDKNKDKKKDGGSTPPAGGFPGMGGGFQQPGMGFQGPGGAPGMSMPGGGGGDSRPGGSGMGMGGMGMPGMPGGQGANTAPVGPRIETGIEFVELKKLGSNHKPAEFIQPVRMVVISASFPYRKQLEEYQKALRYQNMGELVANPADMPVFKGFLVERQIKSVDGKVLQPWTPFDWQAAYKQQIYEKKVLDNEPEDPKIQDSPVIPPDNQHLCVPLPKLAPGRKYPSLSLNTILDTADKLKKTDSGASNNSIWGRGKGDSDIFDRSGTGGEPTEPKDNKEPMDSASSANVLQGIPEYVLVRFLDCTVRVGYVYEYRLRMKVANPNKGKDKLVGRPDDAKAEELIGEWADVRFQKDGRVATGLTIPLETEVYADPLDKKNYNPSSKDEIKLQLQTWLEAIRPQKDNPNYVEQVGDWVVTDLRAYRGQFIGGTENVKLPLWSPTAGGYQFKELGKKSTAKDKGTVGVDFVSYALLVDFEGGRMPPLVYRNRAITDEAGTEILMMTYDGRLVARSNVADEKNGTRREHEVAWNEWQKETEKAVEKPKEGGNNPFGPGGTGPKP
ncbi:MAG TPA: hypothetical protein VGZ47_09390 [Gemmataceae bacterium]|jgi:hypothetical protein|nr:hypothetical protein [Gemmataceae bacterium]